MCNDYRLHLSPYAIARAFSEIRIPLRLKGGVPNLEPRDQVRIGGTAPVVRRVEDGALEPAQLRWSWPGPPGRPVSNFRSEGRHFATGRCLIPAEAFYEFTAPLEGSPKRVRKPKWAFWLTEEPWFCIAGLWRTYADGKAFTTLTTTPSPDIAPYHHRQIVVLGA